MQLGTTTWPTYVSKVIQLLSQEGAILDDDDDGDDVGKEEVICEDILIIKMVSLERIPELNK